MTDTLTITAPGLATITTTGLTLRAGISINAYHDLGRDLIAMRRMVGVYLADYARAGIERIGDTEARGVWAALETETGEAGLAKQLDLHLGLPALAPSARTWQLSGEHYLVAERECETPDDAAKWLAVAAEAKLDARQLQLTIRAGEVRRAKPTPAGTRVALPSLWRVVAEWRHFAAHAVTAERLSAEERADTLRLLQPIVDYAASLSMEAQGVA